MVRVCNTESHGSTPFVSALEMFAGVIFLSVGIIEGELHSSFYHNILQGKFNMFTRKCKPKIFEIFPKLVSIGTFIK